MGVLIESIFFFQFKYPLLELKEKSDFDAEKIISRSFNTILEDRKKSVS